MNLKECNKLLREGKSLQALEEYVRISRQPNYEKLKPLLTHNIMLAISRLSKESAKMTAVHAMEALKERSLKLLDSTSSPLESTLSENKILRSRVEKITPVEIKGWVLLENRAICPSHHFRVELIIGGVTHPCIIKTKPRPDVSKLGGYGHEFVALLFLSGIELTPLANKAEIKILSSDLHSLHACDLDPIQISADYSLENNERATKRIVAVSHDLRNCGAQNSLRQLVSRLINTHNLEFTVISPIDGPLRSLYERLGVKVLIDKSFKFGSSDPLETITNICNQAHLLKTISCDLVICNTLHTSLTAISAASISRNVLVIPRESESPLDLFSSHDPLSASVLIMNSLVSTLTVFVSSHTKEVWTDLGFKNLEKALVIPNGIDFAELYAKSINMTRCVARKEIGISEEEFVFLCVGTVTQRKGQRTIVDAFVKLAQELETQINMSLILVGIERNDYSRELIEYTNKLPARIKDKIFLFDATKQPNSKILIQAYKSADCFVLASEFESYPRVLMEALSYSNIIVSTKCYGVKEMLRHDEALFFEYGDTDNLCQAFKTLVSSLEIRKSLKAKSSIARDRLTTLEQMCKMYYSAIKSLVQS